MSCLSNGKAEKIPEPLELICSTDVTHNRKKALSTLKRKTQLRKKAPSKITAVTPNQVAKQLIYNSKPFHNERGQQKSMKKKMEDIL